MVKADRNAVMLELRRKLFHLTFGLIIALFVYFLKPIYGKWVLLPIFIGILGLMFLQRFRGHRANRILMSRFERDHDARFLYKGAIMYGIGMTFPVLALPVPQAAAVIAVLSVGDAASTLIGKFYGKRRPRGRQKSIEGLLAFVLFSIPAAYIFVQNFQLSLLLSIFGALTEFLSPVDDNIAIPAVLTVVLVLLY